MESNELFAESWRVVNFWKDPVPFRYNGNKRVIQPGEEVRWPANIANAAAVDLKEWCVVVVGEDEDIESARMRALEQRQEILEERANWAQATVNDHEAQRKVVHRKDDHRERIASEIEEVTAVMLADFVMGEGYPTLEVKAPEKKSRKRA